VIRHGDIRWYRFRSPDKRRPVLVVARPALLPRLSLVPVVPVSTQVRGLPQEVLLDQSDGLAERSTLKPEWVRAVDPAALGPFIGSFAEERWAEVRRALLYVFGLDDAAG
jgi:mRNA interferase MazF